MLVRLSGDKYIESNHITGIEKYISSQWEWVVYTVDGHEWLLTTHQFDELMDCLPSPVTSKTYRKGA